MPVYASPGTMPARTTIKMQDISDDQCEQPFDVYPAGAQTGKNFSLIVFERELEKKRAAESRQRIKEVVLQTLFFRAPHDSERSRVLTMVGASWLQSIEAWHVDRDHRLAGEIKQLYYIVNLSDADADLIVDKLLAVEKDVVGKPEF